MIPRQPLRFNKALELEDFSDPELIEMIRDCSPHKHAFMGPEFPAGAEYNKDWEIAMAIRTLRHFGALGPESLLLGVAAGTEDTIFYLTRHAKLVFATDRYVESQEWSPITPFSMLLEPSASAPFDCDPDSVVVEHMDGRLLRFPDNTFDGIFSSGSIEHFGGHDDVAASAYEMGRVLKPGGVLSVSTVVKSGGTGRGDGFPGTLVLTKEQIQKYIIEASGLEAIDPLEVDVSDATLATTQDLLQAMLDKQTRLLAKSRGEKDQPDWALWDFPHLLLEHEGYVFNSVHVALRKTAEYPVVPNEWAKPSKVIRESVEKYNNDLIARQTARLLAEAGVPAPQPQPEPVSAAPQLQPKPGDTRGWIEATSGAIAELRGLEQRVSGWIAQNQVPPLSEGWRPLIVEIRPGMRLEIFIDSDMSDPITHAYSWGQGHRVDPAFLGLMLSQVAAGDAVLDLGAFIGTYSLTAAAAGCRVLSVDASPYNAALLRASAARNGFRHMHVVHAAVSDTAGPARFFVHGPWGQLLHDGVDQPTEDVWAVKVDDLVARVGWDRVAFIKMDVEGSEVAAARGMHRLLSRPDAPSIMFESNWHTLRFFNATPSDLLATLEGFGYTSYLLEDGRLIPTLPSDLQPETVTNYLAVKGHAPQLEGWVIADPMSHEERIAKLLNESCFDNPDHRMNFARIIRHADPKVREDPAIVEALDSLVDDPEEGVRKAASWRLSANSSK